MKVVSFSIFKGGTGKTTSTVNTAAALVRRGKKVLLVDLDQQAQATKYLGLDPEESPNLFEVYSGLISAASAVRPTDFGIDVLAAHGYMAAIESALEKGDEMKLDGFLQPLRPLYDFILVDTPPGKSRLTFNGLAAADLILVPCATQRMSVDGIGDTISYLQTTMWKKYESLDQEIRILFTMYRATTNESPALIANARRVWRDNVLNVTIPHAQIFSTSYNLRKPVSEIDPKHPGAIAYDVFADWLVKHEETAA
jgi:chromosome partitioning protein